MAEKGCVDFLAQQTITQYYREFYDTAKKTAGNDDLRAAILRMDFKKAAENYKWIKGQGANILVPYSGLMEQFDKLAGEARAQKMDAKWIRSARALSVNQTIYGDKTPAYGALENITIRARGESIRTDWWILTDAAIYDERTGFDKSKYPNFNQ